VHDFKNSNMKYLLLITTFLFGMDSLQSQSVINAASNSASFNNQLHEWAVGEMCAVATVSTASLIVTQGFLQPGETMVFSEEIKAVVSGLMVFPNPTSAIATLQGRFSGSISPLAIQLVDANGRVLKNAFIPIKPGGQIEHEFDLTPFTAGTYFLSINASGLIKTFPIIKL
jgi:hypothetical protein